MEQTYPLQRRQSECNGNSKPLACAMDESEVHALMEENAQLRQVVINLSKLVLKRGANRRRQILRAQEPHERPRAP
jgi:hypothetical protein